MEIDLRPGGDDDRPAIRHVQQAAYGYTLPAGITSPWVESCLEAGGVLADVDGRVVGVAGAFDSAITLPGCVDVACSAITGVGVLPTHRRRGALRALIGHQLARMRHDHATLTVLRSTEATIYERFGFGLASRRCHVSVDTSRARLRPDETPGRLGELSPEMASRALPELTERRRLARPGMVRRPDLMWDHVLRDHESVRGGASGLFHVARVGEGGTPDGFVSYRIAESWSPAGPANTAVVTQICGVDRSAELEMWRFVLSLDLVSTVTAQVATDDPLFDAVVDPRAVQVNAWSDDLWARILDLPAALTSRRYEHDGEIVIGVVDWDFASNTGHFRVTVADGCATVERTEATPDATGDISVWSSLLLGGASAVSLGVSGRLTGDADAVDRLFGTMRVPFSDVNF